MGPRGPGEAGVRAIGRPFSFPGIGGWRRPVRRRYMLSPRGVPDAGFQVDAVEAADFLDAGGRGNVDFRQVIADHVDADEDPRIGFIVTNFTLWPTYLANFMRTLALPKEVEHWSLTTLREKLVKIGAKVVRHGRNVTFQLAEVAAPRELFQKILGLIDDLRRIPVSA